MNAIELLINDHRTVEGLFERFEGLGPSAHKSKRNVMERMIKELSVHAAIEETMFYPAVKEISDELRTYVMESLEEHHVVKWVLSELDGRDPEDERFDAKASVLIENVRHHVKEEEGSLFPKVRKALPADVLNDLGAAMAKGKKGAPTRPHPRSPDEPPGVKVAGAAAAIVDRIRDFMRDTAKDAERVASRAERKRSGTTRTTRRRSGTRAAAGSRR